MSNMKKATTKVIILNIFGYLFFLAGVGVLVWFFIKHPLDQSYYFYIGGSFLGIFIALGLLIAARSVRVRAAESREYHLAYYDRNYNIYNENYFHLGVEKRRTIKNRKFTYIGTLDLDKPSDVVGSGVTTASLDVSRAMTRCAAETIVGRYKVNANNVLYGLRSSGAFLIYMEADDPKIIIKEMDALYQAINSNVHKKGVPTTLTYRTCLCEDDKKLSIDDIIARCEIARNSMYMPLEGNIVIFEDTMIQKSIDELELAHDIENAIKNHEFEVFYQPKFDLKAEKFTGAEALIRWRHPTKGIVNPATFIPFAERNDQIIEIDRYMFEHVCQDLAYWKKRGSRLVNVSVNLSRNGIYRTDLIQFLTETMEKFAVSPLQLELELTESSARRDMLYLLSIIKQLKALHIKLAVDDFGTGYSSLSNLRKLPMDTLKIDKSFFDSVEVDKKSRDIAKTTIAMAKALDMKVVAEGIQTAKQVAICKASECDYIQGYYYSKPLSREEFELFLKNNEFEHKK